MVADKTGGLFRLAVGLMKCFSSLTTTSSSVDGLGNRENCCVRNGSAIDFGPLLHVLSLYFQIRDDYLNLCS